MKPFTLFAMLSSIVCLLCSNAKAQATSEFCGAMARIRTDMVNDFSSVKGAMHMDERNRIYWESAITLPASRYSRIEGKNESERSTAYYLFVKTNSYTDAESVYNQIKDGMATCKPSGWHEETDNDFADSTLEYIFMDGEYFNYHPGQYISLQLAHNDKDGNYYVDIIFGTTLEGTKE
jgi:hypothetical protein